MLKLFPLKIPTDSDIGTRFKAAAEAAGLTYWELLGRMLKLWDAQPTAQLSLFPDSSTERMAALEAEVAALKNMVSNMVTTEKTTKMQEESNPPNMDTYMVTTESNPPVPDIDISDTKAFETAYAELERDGHVLIWKLRKELDWPRKRFDAMIRHLRDAGRFSPMQGAETESMTKEQVQAAFVDENGLRHHTIMPASAPTAAPMREIEPEVEPTAPAPEPEILMKPKKRAPKPPVIPTSREFLKILEESPEVSPAPEEPLASAPRKRGRPPKVQKL